MAIVKWTTKPLSQSGFLSEFDRLRSRMQYLFDSASGLGAERGVSRSGVFPLMNVSSDENNLYVTAELPGVSPEHLELSVEKNNLTLRGERKIAEADQKVSYHRRERESGFFRRVIDLPVKIDADQVKAESKNGVLSVILPKAKEAKPRQISVNIG